MAQYKGITANPMAALFTSGNNNPAANGKQEEKKKQAGKAPKTSTKKPQEASKILKGTAGTGSLADKYKQEEEEKEAAIICLHLKASTLDALTKTAKNIGISRNKLINKILEDATQGE